MRRYFDEVLRDKPSLYLRLEESSGGVAVDVSGNDLHGTYQGAPTLGVVGAMVGYEENSAVGLNGTTQYVSVPDNALLDHADKFSLELWFKITGAPTGTDTLICKGANSYEVILTGSAPTAVNLRREGGPTVVAGAGPVSYNVWHHLVITKDGAETKIYLDNVDATSPGTDRTMSSTAVALNIGRDPSLPGNFFAGSIDEVAIYPHVLSPARVEAHYKSAITERISMNETPYEILSGPGTIYRAPVGASFPDPDVAPGMQWTEIGTSGPLNLSDAGISIGHPQTISKFRPLGSGAPSKAWRSEEDLIVKAVLVDLTLEQYMESLNRNTVTELDGFATVGLHRGISVAECALLVRFDFSPYRSDGTSQYECPRAVQLGQPEVVFNRGTGPAMLALEWHVLIDLNASSAEERLGRYKAKLADT